MTQYNFKVGDRVKFKDTKEQQDYRKERNFLNEFVILGFDDKSMNDSTLANFNHNGEIKAVFLRRLELVEEAKPCQADIQEAIDTLIKAGYKVTLSKE